MSVFIVSGVHWNVPGTRVCVCSTAPKAVKRAMEMINGMERELGLPLSDTMEEGLKAINSALENEGLEADVWIEEYEAE